MERKGISRLHYSPQREQIALQAPSFDSPSVSNVSGTMAMPIKLGGPISNSGNALIPRLNLHTDHFSKINSLYCTVEQNIETGDIQEFNVK